MFILEECRNGDLTLKFNNKYIHSRYNPTREAEVLFENEYSNSIKDNTKKIVIVGLGLGYHIKEILNRTDDNIKILVYEYNYDILKLCKKVNSELFSNSRVEIISNKDNKFYEKLSKSLEEVNDIFVHKPSLEVIKEINKEFYDQIRWYCIKKESIIKNQKILSSNFEKNKKSDFKYIEEVLMNNPFSDKPCVIVAAGPSLQDEIENLKENRNRFNIISVGSALKKLLKEGIRPDAFVIIDGNEVVHKQIKGIEHENIPLYFLSTACKDVVLNYKGPKYMFFNENFKNNMVIETGKTVAVASLNIAINGGAKEIILIGQDLAPLNGKSHVDGFSNIVNDNKDTHLLKNIKVKDINGEYIYTTEGYIYFKKMIEDTINKNKEITFINCSKGVYINGCKHTKFIKYLNEEEGLGEI